MKRFSSALIGIFVAGAIALAVIGIIAFGGQLWWGDRKHVAIFFHESVQGLERGSAVRLKGVRVGRVSSIDVAYVGDGAVVRVVCELDRSPFVVHRQEEVADLRGRETLERMVASGLQARLELIGITGMLYLEMDFFGVPSERALSLEHPELVVVPSVPSALAGLTDNLAEIARELGSIDFAGIGQSVSELLSTANRTLDGARIDELSQNLRDAVVRVNNLLESDELMNVIQSAGQTFEDVGRLARRIEEEIDPMADNIAAVSMDLQQTLREAGEAFSAVQNLTGPRMGLGDQMTETLRTIERAARSVERLADYLERNPQAILRGRGDEW